MHHVGFHKPWLKRINDVLGESVTITSREELACEHVKVGKCLSDPKVLESPEPLAPMAIALLLVFLG